MISKLLNTKEDSKMSQEELMMLLEEAQRDGSIDKDEGALLKNAVEFRDLEAQDILTPRVDLIAVSVDSTKEEVAESFTESHFSRLLVYDDDIDRVVGVIHQKDFYTGNGVTAKPIRDIITQPIFIHPTEKVSDLLKLLQSNQSHIAIVIDEYGGTLGIVTMEDILEELVGEIWDEHDEATEDFRRQSDGSWIVLGSAGVDDLYERLGLPEDEDIDSNTVNGLVQEKTCHLPKVGDRFTLGEYDGVVTRTAKRRVTEVRLTPAEKPEPKKEEDEKPHFNRLTNK